MARTTCVHAAVVVAMVMADRHQVERLDSLAPEGVQGGVLGRAGVDQGGLALGRTDQDRVALADVEDLDRGGLAAGRPNNCASADAGRRHEGEAREQERDQVVAYGTILTA